MILTVFMAVLPSLAMMIFTSLQHTRHHMQMIQDEALRQAKSIAFLQENMSQRITRILETASCYEVFRNGSPEARTAFLKMVLDQNPVIDNIAYSDKEGIVLVSPGLAPGTDLSDRRHIREAMEKKTCCIGEYVLSRSSRTPSLPFALPVLCPDGELKGVFSLVYKLSEFEQLFENISFPEETIFGLVDSRGIRLFFRPDKSTNPVGGKILQSVWDGISGEGASGIITRIGSDDIKRFYAYQKLYLPGSGSPYMYVVVGYPEYLAYRELKEALIRDLALILLLVAVVTLLAVNIGNAAFGRRFYMLIQTADSIRNGNLSARSGIEYNGSDISKVAEALDDMAEQLELRNRMREKEEAVLKDSLEQKDVMLQEIHHRVKNNLQLILSMVHLQTESSSGKQDFANKIRAKINAIATVHELLYESGDFSSIRMDEYLPRLIRVTSEFGKCSDCSIDADNISLDLKSAVPLVLIANELIMNSYKYAAPTVEKLKIDITMRSVNGEIQFVYADNGPGMPQEPTAGNGLGMTLVNALTGQLEGGIRIDNDNGIRVTITFPHN